MAPSTAQNRPPAKPLWRGPLVVGLCFALGYGITQRLLALGLPALVQLGQGFDVRDFPGTSLESLRLRFGREGPPVQADLERQRLEAEQRQADLVRQRQEQQLEAERLQQQQQRLSPALEPEAAPPPPAAPELPPAPQLPPPEAP